MPADGSIIIDTRVNNKGAEADLKALQAKAKSTAQQIAALDKQLTSATGKRTKLAGDLAAAKQQAEATAKALDEVNTKLDAARAENMAAVQKEFPGMSAANAASCAESRTKGQYAADYAQSDRLVQQLAQQEEKAAQLNADYQAQEATLQQLNAQHQTLSGQLQQELAAVNRQASAMTGLATAGNALKTAWNSLGAFSKKLFGTVSAQLKQVHARLDAITKGFLQFRNRLMGVVSGALVFNLISAGLRSVTSYMGQALTASSALRTALGNLSGAAQTAAAPLIQVLTPALTALANAAATVFSYIAKLVAFLTGTTVSAAQQAAAGVSGVGSAASDTAKDVDKATRSLAGFDEITRLDAPQDTSTGGGGGGGASAITPNFDFEGKSPFLDSLLAAIEAGDWYQVGELIAQKLNDSMAAIDWGPIDAKAIQWATNLYTALNGAVQNLDWGLLGSTLGNALNTVTHFIDTFFQGFDWVGLGAGIGSGLNNMISTIDWVSLGHLLSDKFMALLETLHGFLQTFDWAALGRSVATMLIAAFSNIDWVQAAGDLSKLAIGILTALNTALAEIDWSSVGQTIIDMLKAIDWATLFRQLGELLAQVWPVVLAAVLIPGIATFVTGTVIPAAISALGSLVDSIIADIGGWPALLIGVLMLGLAAIGAAVAQWLYEHWDELTAWFDEKWAEFSESWAEFWNTVFEKGKEIWNTIRDAWQDFWENLSNKFNEMRTNITAAWNEFWLQVSNKAKEIWNNIQSNWQNFWSNVFSKFNTMKANLSQAWNSLWTGMRDKVGAIWSGIVEKVRGGANSVLGFINGLISKVVNGINGMIDALNSLSFDVPEWLGGGTFGFSIGHINAPQIPYRAQGAVIPPNREFLAVLGDQSSGTNIEAPLSTIEQAVANVLENQLAGQMAGFEAVVAALREVRQAIYDTELTEAGVGRAAQRWQRRQAIMQGV